MGFAVITGASAGLGVHFAKRFARDGHSLVLVARRKELLEKLSSEIRSQHPSVQVHVIEMDLGLADAGQKLMKQIESEKIEVEFLVNNAGFGEVGPFAEIPLKRQMQMIDLNVRTLVELTHLVLPQMLERKSGRILNVGSTAGFQPGPFMATYFASKAFVNSFSEALNEELKNTGVSLTVLAPGATATEFAKVANSENTRLFTKNSVASADGVVECGYKAMMSGEALVIPGVFNRLLMESLRVSPRKLVRKMTSMMNRPG